MTDDVAAVLARWLAERLSAEADQVEQVEVAGLRRAGVGQSSEMVLFDATWQAAGTRQVAGFVLRRQPGPDGIFRHPDIVREFRVLDAVRRAALVPVPRVRWLERDPAVLGAPFLVMDRVDGVVPAGKPSIHSVGWLPTLSPARRRTVWQSAVDTLAAIHAVDWRATHAFLCPDPTVHPGLTRHLDTIADWYRWAVRGRAFPITDAALRHVLDRRRSVTPTDPVLLWGDARLGNMMFAEDGSAVRAVLDWEVATVGPAAVDVAHWLIFDEFATTAGGVDRLDGYPDRRATVDHYRALTGRALPDLDYFEVLQCLFLATTLIRQTDAAVSAGRMSATTRMAHDNTVTQMLARRLGLPVPELAPDYLRHRRAPAVSRQPTGSG